MGHEAWVTVAWWSPPYLFSQHQHATQGPPPSELASGGFGEDLAGVGRQQSCVLIWK